MIELKSISKSFAELSVLEEIDLTIPDGEKLCIIGKSGCGKSVLLKLITGLLEAESGEIWIDGDNTALFGQREWSGKLKQFGVVFQGSALFDSLTVYENVGIRFIEEGKLKANEIKEKVENALSRVGLETDLLRKVPSELSGGMKKRVAIARAIIHGPQYLLYDEPTTGLDPENAEIIDQLIEELSQAENQTTLIVTHDMTTVRNLASSVAFLYEQKLHFHGTCDTFFKSENSEIKRFLSREKFSSVKE